MKNPNRETVSKLEHLPNIGKKFDPCVIDVFISAIDFMEGGEPSAWWEFTSERKKIG